MKECKAGVTISFLVKRSRLIDRFPRSAEKKLTEIQRNSKNKIVANAIEPMFDDISERKRHIYFNETFVDCRRSTNIPPVTVNGQPTNTMPVGAPIDANCGNDQEIVSFIFPKRISWETEGIKSAVVFNSELTCEKVESRSFWYLYSNGDLSYNISFNFECGHEPQNYFGLSLLQKKIHPSENCNDLLLIVTNKSERIDIQDYIRHRFNKHFSDLFGCVFDAWWDYLVERDRKDISAQNVQHYQPLHHRSSFILCDKYFDKLLSNRREEASRLNGYKFGVSSADVTSGSNEVQLYEFTNSNLPIRKFDEDSGVDCGSITPDELAFFFISGFSQNVIDLFHQDGAEVSDGADPMYPEGDAMESYYWVFASQDSIYEFVKSSRSYDNVGKNYIGTCPYLFLVHATLFHDEHLIIYFEELIRDQADTICRAAGAGFIKRRLMANTYLNSFSLVSLEITSEVERYLHQDVFHYDTERDFYRLTRQARGTDTRVEHWRRFYENISATANEFYAINRKRSDSILQFLMAAIAFVSVFQTIYAFTDSIKDPTPVEIQSIERGEGKDVQIENSSSKPKASINDSAAITSTDAIQRKHDDSDDRSLTDARRFSSKINWWLYLRIDKHGPFIVLVGCSLLITSVLVMILPLLGNVWWWVRKFIRKIERRQLAVEWMINDLRICTVSIARQILVSCARSYRLVQRAAFRRACQLWKRMKGTFKKVFVPNCEPDEQK